MPQITVNHMPVEAREGETILSALSRAGIRVPTLCHMENLLPTGACRLCVVEVEGQRGLVPSCSFPVSDGMKIQTHSPKAVQARKTIIELLLSNHPDDCLYCLRNGNCDLQSLAVELGVAQRRFRGARSDHKIDVSSPSLVRDPSKCILCGKCVRVCEEIQGVAAIDFVGRGSKTVIGCAFDQGLNVSSCINCGQCITVCPTGALTEKSHIDDVLVALSDPNKICVVQHAPAVSVTVAEHFGLKPGQDAAGILNAALKRLGFQRVFDTSFTADLTIMEEGSELVHRVQNGGVLPMLTSCSPGWIKYVETFYPDMTPNLSSCKSPQQMLGALIKSLFSERKGVAPDRIYSVSIMPCTAKKFEAGRPEMSRQGVADIDAVLTTREILRLLQMRGINPASLAPEGADNPFGERSGAGKIFGTSGGVMEAALRTAHKLLTGAELNPPRIQGLRGHKGIKEAHMKIGDLEVGVAVVSGLGNARKLLEEVRAGRKDLHFIEVMTCPGGCVAGGGQPVGIGPQAIKARMQGLYDIDRDAPIQTSHQNPEVARLYDEYLGKPLSEKSHHLLHTHYHSRDVLK